MLSDTNKNIAGMVQAILKYLLNNIHLGKTVVTDVQFGHLFMVCIKYDYRYLWLSQKDIPL